MIEKFTIGASRTINLGNFESLKVEASLTVNVDLPEENDPQTNVAIWQRAKLDAQGELRKLLEDTYRNQYKAPKEKK